MNLDHNTRVVVACARLVDRAGAKGFEFGYLDDDPDHPRWWARASYRGMVVMAEEHTSPGEACLELALRLLCGATCRCLRPVALRAGDDDGCVWRLVGDRWEPGCDAESITMQIGRGDYGQMRRAFDQRRRGNHG